MSPTAEMARPGLKLLSLYLLYIALTMPHSLSAAESEAIYGYQDESVAFRVDGRITGVQDRTDKDFVLGALIPVNRDDPSTGQCEESDTQIAQALEQVEAILFAIDTINANSNLLGNLTLGFDVRDTCTADRIGLDEALDLIITGSQFNIESCVNNSPGGEVGQNGTEYPVPTLGIIGAANSAVSVPVAALARLFSIPQISHLSTSILLNDRNRYPFFYRTVPPDTQQARAMIDLLLAFNWTHISTIFNRDAYGEPAIIELKKLATENGMCIDVDEAIEENFNETDYQKLAEKLRNSTAKVVVLFTTQSVAAKLLNATANLVTNLDVQHKFNWIASDAWARIGNTHSQFNDIVAGHYGFTSPLQISEEFNDYLSQLTIQNNKRDPWFPQFYAALAGCVLNESNSTCGDNCCNVSANVTGLPNYNQRNVVPVIDAVYTFANALDQFLTNNSNCDQPVQWYRANCTCKGQRRQLDGSNLLEHIANIDFNSPTGNRIVFNANGAVEGKYDIINYQVVDSGGVMDFSYQTVGIWDSSVIGGEFLKLNEDMLQFGLDDLGIIVQDPPISQCGNCVQGQYLRVIQSSCCGVCEPCLGQNYSNDPLAPSCASCSELGEMWGNNPTTGSDDCVAIEESFIEYNDPWSIVVLIISILGLVVVTVTACIFGIHWTTPVVKSSGREQMVLLLIGIGISFVMGFIYVAPPSVGICSLQRIGLWLSYSLMFGAILIKTVRVAIVFYGWKTKSPTRFLQPHYVVLFTFLIVIGQMVLVVASLGFERPDTSRDLRRDDADPNDFPTIVMTCVSDPLVILILSAMYETALVILSTIFGVMSFKYPANFNEAKYISFCTFALLVFWLAFIPSYFATQNMQEFQNPVIAMAVQMSAFTVLVCVFGPKLYIALLQKKRNSDDFNSHKNCQFHSTPNEISLPGGTGCSITTNVTACDSSGITSCHGYPQCGDSVTGMYTPIKLPITHSFLA